MKEKKLYIRGSSLSRKVCVAGWRSDESSAGGYRFGFNGKENDNEVKGEGNQQDYGMRVYDPRLGRFLSVDPLTKSYPELTPYQFASNRPIDANDLDGAEASHWDPVRRQWMMPSDAIRHPVPPGAFMPSAEDAKAAGNRVPVEYIVPAATALVVVSAPTVVASSGPAFWRVAGWAAQPQNQMLVGETVTFTAGVLNPGPEDISPGSGSDELGRYARQALKRVPRLASGVIKTLKPCGCFTDSTLILTKTGYKEISTIRPGDFVMAYDDSTGTPAWKIVNHIFETNCSEIISLYVGSTVVSTTNEHPFRLRDRWTKAMDLVVGDTLMSLIPGKSIVIDSIKVNEGVFKVYNLLVDQYHTFYVSNDNILVHNGVPCPVSFQKLGGILGGDWISKKIHADVILGKLKTEISFRLSADGNSIVVKNVFNNLKPKDAKKAIEYGDCFYKTLGTGQI